MLILQLLAIIVTMCLVGAWAVAVVMHVKSPVPAPFRTRLVTLSLAGLATALVPAAMAIAGADLVPVAVAVGVGIALLPIARPLMDRWTTQGRLQLVHEGRNAYTGLPDTSRRPPHR